MFFKLQRDRRNLPLAFRAPKGRKNVAHGASRGDWIEIKVRKPREGRKKFNVALISMLNFLRPSRGFDSLLNFVPMTYVMGYILSPLRGLL
jgi:hypothetical protein